MLERKAAQTYRKQTVYTEVYVRQAKFYAKVACPECRVPVVTSDFDTVIKARNQVMSGLNKHLKQHHAQ